MSRNMNMLDTLKCVYDYMNGGYIADTRIGSLEPRIIARIAKEFKILSIKTRLFDYQQLPERDEFINFASELLKIDLNINIKDFNINNLPKVTEKAIGDALRGVD